jgi:uncharacterized membrane protein YeaQ/YmgE (transglycosylase-associated protein family)
MSTIAEIIFHLEPGGIVAWLVVGLIAGWCAGFVMKGAGYGLIGDIVVGLLGAMIGGFLSGFFITGNAGFWSSVGVAFIGACILIVIARFVALKRTRL